MTRHPFHLPPAPPRAVRPGGVVISACVHLLLVWAALHRWDANAPSLADRTANLVETALRMMLPPNDPEAARGAARAPWREVGPGQTATPSATRLTSAPTTGRSIGAPPTEPVIAEDPLAAAAREQSAFTVFDLDSAALRDPSSAAPRYPAELEARGVEGIVVVRFVVDSTGLVDLDSFRVMSADHPGFGVAVQDALPRMRFRPAMMGTRPVRQLVEVPFAFRIQRKP